MFASSPRAAARAILLKTIFYFRNNKLSEFVKSRYKP